MFAPKNEHLQAHLHMTLRTAIFGTMLLVAIAASGFAVSAATSESRACPNVEAGWHAFNLLQAQQALRVVATLMAVC